ncbi:MAG: SMP-30/gluconolactonase/LRE family protein [Pseudomonadota bacterium]
MIRKIFYTVVLCVAVITQATAAMLEKIVTTNAHEGPVCVARQDRLYYATKPDFQAGKIPHTSIMYLDLRTNKVHTFIKDANMTNGMWLAPGGKALLAAEQGNKNSPGGIFQIDLKTAKQTVVVDKFHGKPFNSPNKVIVSKGGVIYFSDPDYGYNQGFKPKPQLLNAVYAYAIASRQLRRLSTAFIMPHGLALSPDEKYLYVGDTAAVDGKSGDPDNPYDSHGIYKIKLQTPVQLGTLEKLETVSPGIPDGFIILPNGQLYVAAGDGIHHYAPNGRLIDIIKIPGGAVNLTPCNGYLYITADKAIYRSKLG